ncbi:MAG TPA: DUF805 domain-containing protein [Allosphingosinicella sp.]|jgi:uncharacterized membrane protein YhaH (DUF805 family)|nr:DUF805 domain-containing protein [Allosphingosinicella sp.]
MDVLLRPWRHYADFSGRSRRTEYFLFFATYYGSVILMAMVGSLFSGLGRVGEVRLAGAVTLGLMGIVVLAGIVPAWAVSIRRLHDQDKSGWFILLNLIPYIGFIFMLIMAFWPGDSGENRFGCDPREGEGDPEAMATVFR